MTVNIWEHFSGISFYKTSPAFCLRLELILNFSKMPHLAVRLKKGEKSPHANVQWRRRRRKKRTVNGRIVCPMQPWVVKATRPNIYDQEHTIMNNARYGRTAQRIHGPVSSLGIGHSLTFNGSLYSLVFCLLLWHVLLLLLLPHENLE